MINQIDHIGIAVRDLDAQVVFYRDILGLLFEGFEDLPERGLRVAVFKAGSVAIELLQSVKSGSTIDRFISKRGEGIHHIAFNVDDTAASLDKLKQKGVRLINETPSSGAHGKRVAFLHPKSTFSVLMELCSENKDIK